MEPRLLDLNQANDEVYEDAERNDSLDPHRNQNLRNCLGVHDSFLSLVTTRKRPRLRGSCSTGKFGIGKSWAGFPRKTVFRAYAYRWVLPMVHVEMADPLLDQCASVERQMLGAANASISYYNPS